MDGEINKMINILRMPRGKEKQTFKNRLHKNKGNYILDAQRGQQ